MTAKVQKPAKREAPPKALTPWQQWTAEPEKAIAELCDAVVGGASLSVFVKKKAFAYSTVSDWLAGDEVRAVKYARAREDRSDLYADEIVSISDETSNDTYIDDNGVERTNHEVVARSKLRVDARKWVASKLKPRVYGEKLDLTQSITIKDLPDDELLERAVKLQALLAGKALL